MLRKDDEWTGNMEMMFSSEIKDMLCNHYVVSSMDHLDALQSSTLTTRCRSKAKNNLLQNLLTHREVIL